MYLDCIIRPSIAAAWTPEAFSPYDEKKAKNHSILAVPLDRTGVVRDAHTHQLNSP